MVLYHTNYFNNAINACYIGKIKDLLSNGYECYWSYQSEESPLTCAANNGNKEIIKLLLDNGVNVTKHDLESAFFNGDKGIIKLLIEIGRA